MHAVILKALPANLQSFFHDLAGSRRAYFVLGSLASQMAHAFDDLGDAIGGLHDTFTVPQGDLQRHRAVRPYPAEKVHRRTMNDRKRIIDLMSDASGHHAQRGKPRRGFDLRFHFLSFGNVHSRSHQPYNAAMVIQDWSLGGGNVAHGTVRTDYAILHEFLGFSLDRALRSAFDERNVFGMNVPAGLLPGQRKYSRDAEDRKNSIVPFHLIRAQVQLPDTDGSGARRQE